MRRLQVIVDCEATTCGTCFHITCGGEKDGKLLPPFRCGLFVEDLGDPPLRRLPACLAAEVHLGPSTDVGQT